MTSHIFMFSFNICLSAMRRFVLFVTDDQYTIISVQRTIHLHCVISSVGKKGDKANKKFNRILSNLMASSQIWRESHYFSNGIKKLLWILLILKRTMTTEFVEFKNIAFSIKQNEGWRDVKREEREKWMAKERWREAEWKREIERENSQLQRE